MGHDGIIHELVDILCKELYLEDITDSTELWNNLHESE